MDVSISFHCRIVLQSPFTFHSVFDTVYAASERSVVTFFLKAKSIKSCNFIWSIIMASAKKHL